MCHQDNLKKLCRFCGDPVLSSDTLYIKDEYQCDAAKAFLVDISNDESSVHPPYLCRSCRLKLCRWRKKKNKTKKTDPLTINIAVWVPHSSSCPICEPSNLHQEIIQLAKEEAAKHGMTSWMEADGTLTLVKHSRGEASVERHIQISQDLTWTAAILGHDNIPMLKKFGPVVSEQNIQELVEIISSSSICYGLLGFDDVVHEGKKINGKNQQVVAAAEYIQDPEKSSPTARCLTVRHSACRVLISIGSVHVCEVCTMFRSSLCNMRSRNGSPPQSDSNNNDIVSSHRRNDLLTEEQKMRKMAMLQKERAKVIKQNEAMRKHIQSMMVNEAVDIGEDEDQALKEIIHDSVSEIDTAIGEEETPHKLLWEEQKKAFAHAEGGQAKQMRWHPAIIRWAIAIYHKSSAAYQTIRKSPFMMLPHESTLRKYMQFTTPKAGINPDCLQFISQDWKLDEIPPFQKNVTLVFDEMMVSSGLVYSKTSGKLIGFTDHGPISNELERFDLQCRKQQDEEFTEKPEIATQVLALMARGIFSPMRVCVGFFPTKTASSHRLYNILWPAVKAVTALGLTVRAFVCDGASWNRKFYSHHTLAKEPGRVSYFTEHPFLRGQRLYFICDVPHLVKSTRNQWENSGWNQKSRNLIFKGQPILWTHLKDLWDDDRGRKRLCPGLRKTKNVGLSHIRLTPSTRMRVSLAAQVLSTTVANALKDQNRHDTKSTELFVRRMDKFFDLLNVRTTGHHIRRKKDDLKPYTDPNDERFKWLTEVFLPWLDEWEGEAMQHTNLTLTERRKMCLSHQTLEGLRITVHTFVDMSKDLFAIDGVKYLLSDKLNQDVLEEYFSDVRGAGGASDMPTVEKVGQIHLNLMVAGSNSVSSTRGNVKGSKRTVTLDCTPLPQKKRKPRTLEM